MAWKPNWPIVFLVRNTSSRYALAIYGGFAKDQIPIGPQDQLTSTSTGPASV